MDHRTLFGISAIILSSAVFVHSFNSANAFPQGPNVSMGSNPIASFYVACGQSSPTVLSTTSDLFIITDILVDDGYSTGGIDLQLNGSNWYAVGENVQIAMNSGLPVPLNSTLSCYSYYGRSMILSGYYAQP